MQAQLNIIRKYITIDKEPTNNYEYQLLVSKLKGKNVLLEDLKAIVPRESINSDKIILISDTHYGLIYENYNYIHLVYEFAKKHGINNIIHGGDFVHGSCAAQKQFYDLNKDRGTMINGSLYDQAITAYENYPMDDNIQNHLLLGNHDYFLLRKYDDMYDFLSSRKDITLLGIKKAYLRWKDYLISINHRISKLDLHVPRVPTIIKFHGHRHEFYYKSGCEDIYLPTLSDDLKFYGGVNYPGFIVVTMEDDMIDIKFYPIINNKIDEDSISLKKDLNKEVRYK